MTPTSTGEPGAAGGRVRGRLAAAALLLGAALLAAAAATGRPGRRPSAPQETAGNLLQLLGLQASAQSLDYVINKTQFQLHTLLTEQRHPKTLTLSERIRDDTAAGLRMLFAVDEDVAARLAGLAADPGPLAGLSQAFEAAILARRRIYVYGCGATGRLAKQMESDFWRPFWRAARAETDLWAKISGLVDPAVEEALVGEMTGADRALISSLEGFEDLQLIGRLQLHDRGVRRGDLVVCVTEGGETSSVIGTALAALEQWTSGEGPGPADSRNRIFFVYNNPDDLLRPFERSRRVLDEPGITKINLTTGPQAITGSTRMQATTIETYAIGSALETAIERVLRRRLGRREMARLGFAGETTLEARLRAFAPVLRELQARVPDIARLTDLEARTYAKGRFATYYAKGGLITVFIDGTERSPTFRLYPLDTVREPKRKCWFQVWTEASDGASAWRALLGRPFRGLDPALYRKPFEEEIEDPYLRVKALASLDRAGDAEQALYDFSFAGANLRLRPPRPGDLGVAALLGRETGELAAVGSSFRRFAELGLASGAGLGLVLVPAPGAGSGAPAGAPLEVKSQAGPLVTVSAAVDAADDPFGLRPRIALKMLLNAHSTAVMAKLGRVVGNTMTNVSPSNLKLVGRATHLILLHVNDTLQDPRWVRRHGTRRPISYGEANAVLFDAIEFLRERAGEAGQAAEVPLSIIRILEALRRGESVGDDEALEIYRKTGLAGYLAEALRESPPGGRTAGPRHFFNVFF